jgi:hypothetical protein
MISLRSRSGLYPVSLSLIYFWFPCPIQLSPFKTHLMERSIAVRLLPVMIWISIHWNCVPFIKIVLIIFPFIWQLISLLRGLSQFGAPSRVCCIGPSIIYMAHKFGLANELEQSRSLFGSVPSQTLDYMLSHTTLSSNPDAGRIVMCSRRQSLLRLAQAHQ